MSLEFRSVQDAGDHAKERLVLRASTDVDIGRYAVFRASAAVDGNPLSGNVSRVYWFENKRIRSGDLVVLYSKSGSDSEKKNNNGSTSHFFYWEASQPLWVKGFVPTVVSTPAWETGEPIG